MADRPRPVEDDALSAADLIRGPGNSWQRAQNEQLPRRRHPLFDDAPSTRSPEPEASLDALWGSDADDDNADEEPVIPSGITPGATESTAVAGEPTESSVPNTDLVIPDGITPNVAHAEAPKFADYDLVLGRVRSGRTAAPAEWDVAPPVSLAQWASAGEGLQLTTVYEAEEQPVSADNEVVDAAVIPVGITPAPAVEDTASAGAVVVLETGPRVDPEALLEHLTPAATIRPRQWWRRVLRLGPDVLTVQRAQIDGALRVPLARPVTVCVAQPRGMAGKTVTTIGICGAFASSRGGGVIAWDNNEGDSNLLDRLERAHQANVGDLLSTAAWFMQPESTMIELERVLQHQSTSFFKALGSDQRTNEAMTVAQFNAIHAVLRKYFPLVVIDTGNSKVAANWQAAITVADVVVVPLKLRPDHIVPAARMIRGLQDLGEQLANRLVLVISCGPGDRHLSGPQTRALFEQYGLNRFPLLEIPTDPVIDEEPVIRWADLADPTQDAYRGLGATVLALATANTN